MTVYFTSDLHIGHRLITELRGFGEDVPAHDAAIENAWRRVVRPDDQVWVLGDLAVSSPGAALALIDSLPGRKHLISGNHDGCHPMHRDSHKRLPAYLEVFESVQAFARRRVAGVDVFLSHFPYTVDRGFETRYPQYRLPDLGAWLLHGHTHLADRRTGPREIHVGVDAWNLSPVALETVEKMMCDGQ